MSAAHKLVRLQRGVDRMNAAAVAYDTMAPGIYPLPTSKGVTLIIPQLRATLELDAMAAARLAIQLDLLTDETVSPMTKVRIRDEEASK